jgi:hypothetical protein
MLDPFISYKEEVIGHLEQFDSEPHEKSKPGFDMKNQEPRGK